MIGSLTVLFFFNLLILGVLQKNAGNTSSSSATATTSSETSPFFLLGDFLRLFFFPPSGIISILISKSPYSAFKNLLCTSILNSVTEYSEALTGQILSDSLPTTLLLRSKTKAAAEILLSFLLVNVILAETGSVTLLENLTLNLAVVFGSIVNWSSESS